MTKVALMIRTSFAALVLVFTFGCEPSTPANVDVSTDTAPAADADSNTTAGVETPVTETPAAEEAPAEEAPAEEAPAEEAPAEEAPAEEKPAE